MMKAMLRRVDTRTRFDRAFEAMGFDAQLVDAVIGDLTEEFDAHVEQRGVVRARLWYFGEMVRSAPALFIAAARRGGPRARLLLTVAVTTVVLAGAAATALFLLRDGPPVGLVSDLADAADNVLLNNTRAIKLPMRVVDQRGHTLDQQQVRYDWLAGMPMNVSPDGAMQCAQRGDAVVRATLGTITKDLAIRCRPVEKFRTASWIDLIAGGAGRELPFEGIGKDGRTVDELRGVLRVRDSSVATLNGMFVRPLSVGQTNVNIAVGDKRTSIRVIVNETVTSFENLRADQHFVARPVRLAQGDTVSWVLPKGNYWIKYIPARANEAPPTITLNGQISCGMTDPLVTFVLEDGIFATLCSAVGPASVELAHGKVGAPFVEGFVVLDIKTE